jgi:hypothetical protein
LNARLSEKPSAPIEVKAASDSVFAAVVISSSDPPLMSRSASDRAKIGLPDITNRVVRSISVDEADATGLDSGTGSPASFEPDLVLPGSLDPRRKKFSPRSRSNSGSGPLLNSSHAGPGFTARVSGKRRNIDECSDESMSPRALPSPYSVPDSLLEGSQPESDHGGVVDPVHRAYAPSPTTARLLQTFEELNVRTAKKSNNTSDHAFIPLPASQDSIPNYSQSDTVEEIPSDGIYIESDFVADDRDIERDGIFDTDGMFVVKFLNIYIAKIRIILIYL